VIPGAKVTAVRTETMASQSTVTSNTGTFALSNLTVGTYNVTINAQGFAPQSIAGVTLDVSQTRNLDFNLSLAGTTQTVGVTAAPPLLNTTNGSLAGLVSEQQVESLPLNGRSIQNLVMLQPGMAQNTGTFGWLSPTWVSNGNRGETAVATLDGANITDAEMGTVQFWNFNLDAIAEFKVQQANYSAEFGQGGGTITQIVSKSGTNRFHGSAFEFIRNTSLDAANYFSTTGPSPFQRNEFGATLGGPILRDRTFFFVEYAGLRQGLGEPTLMSVPTAEQKTGLTTINGYQYQVPLNAEAQKVLGNYPDPNQPSGLLGANTLNFIFKQPTVVNQYSVRIDHKISDKDSIFGRASLINNSQKATDPVAAIENPAFSAANINNPRNYALSEIHIFSPNLINDAIFAVNRQTEGTTAADLTTPTTTTSDGTLSNYGPDSYTSLYHYTYYELADRVNWNWGRHSWAIGAEYRYGQDNAYGVGGYGPNGTYQFSAGTPLSAAIPSTNGGPTIEAGTGSPSGLVSLMEGDTGYYFRSVSAPSYGPPGGGVGGFGLRVSHTGLFVEDNVKLTRRLTANLGLRYEYNSVPHEARNKFSGIVDHGPLFGSLVINPQPLFAPDRLSFAPRLGAAYMATRNLVVRGGFAIFTNVMPLAYADQPGFDFPLASLGSLANAPYSSSVLPVSLPTLTSTSGAAMPPNGNTRLIPANTPINLAPIAAILGPLNGYWPSDRLKNGSTMTGNVTIEQQLPADMALQASYLVNTSTDLYNADYPNGYTGAQPENTPYTNVTAGLGEIDVFYNDAISHYNALQVQLRKTSRSHGLQYQANYTFGKDLTDADSVWAAPGANGGISKNDPTCVKCEYGPASYNLKHRFAANFSYSIPGSWGEVPGVMSKGWQVLGIYSAQSGSPFSITGPYGTLQYGIDTMNGVGARPFFIKTAGRDPQHRAQFFTSDAIDNYAAYFAEPTVTSNITGAVVQTAPGNLARNTYTGPSWWNADLSLLKDTELFEGLRMQFRAEFFNVFNHPTFATPNGIIRSANFGRITSTATAERQIQFGIRFMF
jgi:hypothetical protein